MSNTPVKLSTENRFPAVRSRPSVDLAHGSVGLIQINAHAPLVAFDLAQRAIFAFVVLTFLAAL